jgi:hypothetical protein
MTEVEMSDTFFLPRVRASIFGCAAIFIASVSAGADTDRVVDLPKLRAQVRR